MVPLDFFPALKREDSFSIIHKWLLIILNRMPMPRRPSLEHTFALGPARSIRHPYAGAGFSSRLGVSAYQVFDLLGESSLARLNVLFDERTLALFDDFVYIRQKANSVVASSDRSHRHWQTFIVLSFVTLYNMSYDTEHVRNAEDTPGMITGIPTFAELLDNAALAALYTAIRHESTATGPELVETMDVSKKTVYDYLHKLERAGLIRQIDDNSGTAEYAAEAFELTITVRETEVTITPELIEAIAQKDEYPTIERVLDEHGITTFALVYDLVNAHADGDVTIRQIAELTDLSTGTAYDLVAALYSILSLGDDEASPTTYTPADFDAAGDDLLAEIDDE